MRIFKKRKKTKDIKEDYDNISVSQEVVTAIDNYISDKNIAYRRDDESDETQTILTIINADTNSSAIVRITNMDWM